MKEKKIKRLIFIDGVPTDIYNGFLDIVVILEDDTKYFFEVTTPRTLLSQMDKRNQKFLEPVYPFIIVRELTSKVIEEALETFITEEKNSFWFKLYYSIPLFRIDDLDFIIARSKKEEQEMHEESEEDD